MVACQFFVSNPMLVEEATATRGSLGSVGSRGRTRGSAGGTRGSVEIGGGSSGNGRKRQRRETRPDLPQEYFHIDLLILPV